MEMCARCKKRPAMVFITTLVSEIEDAIQSNSDNGSIGLINSIAKLFVNDQITLEQAKAIQKYKYAAVPSELAESADELRKSLVEKREYLKIGEWSAAYVDADLEQCGLSGSPTKVKSIENVVSILCDSSEGLSVTFGREHINSLYTDAEWEELVALKPNWVFSLI